MKRTSHADILLIMAGGTIAAEPYGDTPDYVTVKDNVRVMSTAAELASPQKVALRDFAIKDSKDITDADINAMAEMIAAAEQTRIVITHGTDRMPENARRLKAALTERFPAVLAMKTVVFTGAMTPLSHSKETDGRDNLADALEVVKHNAKPGVSIVMHRQVFDPERTEKNFEKKAFFER